MDKIKILIVSASFYPQNSPRSFRTTELAKELARQGNSVTVITPKRPEIHDLFEKNYGLVIKDLGKLKWKRVTIKGQGISLLVRRLIFRLSVLLFEYPAIELLWMVQKILKKESGYDLLISVAVPFPVHWGVAASRTERHPIAKTWVADCGDPYMGDTTDSFRKLFYFKYVEKWFCRKTDFITVPIEGAKSAYYPEFHKKIRTIPQGFQLNNLDIPEYRKVFDYPVFAYTGGFIAGKRDPRPMLGFLSTCSRSFKFVVYTSQSDMILPFKNVLKDKLDIRDYIPREELLKILSGMDFLINFDNNTTTQLPSKLIDYSIAGRPVLNIDSGTDFSGLLEFMNGNYNRKMRLEPLDKYDIKEIAERFTNLNATV